MVLSTFATTTALLAFAALSSGVTGHGFMVDPAPDFLPGIDVTAYTSTIIGTSLYPDGIFNTYPEGNVNSFVEHFKNDTRFTSVRDMIQKHQKVIAGASEDCGYTDITKTKHTIKGSSVFWGRNDAANREGFVDSHEGPCEVWCDDNMVQQNMNCVRAYPNKPGNAAEVPIEVAKCANAKKLTFYWVAMHGNEWQIYNTSHHYVIARWRMADCVALASGGSSASAGSGSSSTKTPAPAAKTPTPATTAPAVDSDADDEYPDETPAPATTAPATSGSDGEYPDETPAPATTAPAASGSDDEYPDEDETPTPATSAPATTTSAPAATTSTLAPSPTKKKCTAKTRKLMREN